VTAQDAVAEVVAREPVGIRGPHDDVAAGSRHAPDLVQSALAATHRLDLYCSDQVRFDTWGGLQEFALWAAAPSMRPLSCPYWTEDLRQRVRQTAKQMPKQASGLASPLANGRVPGCQ
jgi:hypothetical protein